LYPVSLSIADIEEAAGGHGNITAELLRLELTSDVHVAYDARELAIGEEVAREVERRVVLSVLDRKWREHLYEMDYLQEGIGLRAMAQRDPLVEYQREGYMLFEAMNEAIKEESIGYLFNVEVEVNAPQDTVEAAPTDGFEAAKAIRAKGLETPKAPAQLHYSAPSDDYSVQEHDEVSAAASATPTTSRKASDPRGGSKKSKNKSRRR
jgi:preprotein translocase subunit SecA